MSALRHVSVVLSSAMLVACSNVPPADLSAIAFTAVDVPRIAATSLTVTLAPDAVTRRSCGSGSFNYQIAYALDEVDRRCLQSVCAATFIEARCHQPPLAGSPELRLVSFTHLLLAHSPGTLPDVTDEVTARWVLLDATGAEVKRFVFVGARSGSTHGGLTQAQFDRAQARAAMAFDDLHRKTVVGLSASTDLVRIAGQAPAR
ncbi:MAG: hypothetical protein J0L57_03120 [Burkholderiales bacterium]|nr:hypothetical protein [Burkholderiales bacterium]